LKVHEAADLFSIADRASRYPVSGTTSRRLRAEPSSGCGERAGGVVARSRWDPSAVRRQIPDEAPVTSTAPFALKWPVLSNGRRSMLPPRAPHRATCARPPGLRRARCASAATTRSRL